MGRFFSKLCLLAVPLVMLVCAELALPPTTFTFRAWEALKVSPLLHGVASRHQWPFVPTALPGPFAPSASLALVEEGDLGHHTPYAQPRSVVWETDEYGYRARAGRWADSELVVVGDSNATGSGLSQDDTLAEVLRTEQGIPAYALAPSNMTGFLADARFRLRPPKYVVIECVERSVLGVFSTIPPPEIPLRWLKSDAVRHLELALVRLKRLNSLSYLRARLDGPRQVRSYGGLLFHSGPEGIRVPRPGHISAAADTLARYAALARDRGFQVAVLIIPDKETVYSDFFPSGPAPTLLPALHRALRERNVTVVDIEPSFRAARKLGQPPYLADDSHWNTTGVRIAASAIAGWVAGEEATLKEQ